MMDGNQPERNHADLALSAQQRAVLEALQSRDTNRFPLSRWYQGALYALRNRHNPDRLSQAAQSLRELLEKLPRVVRESDLQVSSYDFRGKRQSLYDRIQKDKRRYADGWDGRSIDRSLARTLEEFEAYIKQSQRPSRREQVQMAVASIDPLAGQMDNAIRTRKHEEMLTLWQRMEAFAHHNADDADDFDQWLEVLDRTILDLLAPITAENQQEMQRILLDSDRSETDIARIFDLIERRGANYVFFFAEASDPSWIPILKEKGHLAHPLNIEDLGDGRASLPNWWPMRYLARMARLATDEVIQIVADLPDFENPRIDDAILEIALQVPGADSVKLNARVLEYARTFRTFLPYRLPDLLVHWTNENQTEEALELAKAMVYFAPDPDSEEKQLRRREFPSDWTTILQPRPKVEQRDYLQVMEKGIRPLAEAEPYRVACVLISAVNALIYESMHQDDIDRPGEEDYSEILYPELWRPEREILRPTDVLVATMAFACQRVWEKDPASIASLDDKLRERRWKIFRRLRQDLYARYPNQQTKSWIREEILEHQNYNRREHHYEFQHMIRRACESLGTDLLTHDELTVICDAIREGPDREAFRRRAGEAYNEELYQQRQRYFHWKQLRPFQTILFGEYLGYFRDLEQAVGTDITDTDYRPVGEGRSGVVSRRSPRTVEELLELQNEDLLDYINEWDDEHNDNDNWLEEVTIEALSEAFEVIFKDVVIPDAGKLQFWLTNRDRIQRPIYVRAMLKAMLSRIREQEFGDLDLWLETCDWVISHPDRKHEPGIWLADKLRRNPYWGDCRRAAGDLLGGLIETCQEKHIPLPSAALFRLPGLFDMLCTQYEWSLDEGQRVFPDTDSWLDEAINNTRSRALQDVVRFGALLRRDDPLADIGEITATLERRLSPDSAYPLTLAERVILGRSYEEIIALDETWAIGQRSAFFPQDDLSAWVEGFSAFLHFHSPHKDYFEILEDDFKFAVQHLSELAEREPSHAAFLNVLGQWLFRYYVDGQYPFHGGESLIERYYQMTDGHREQWVDLLNYVGRLLYRTDQKMPPDVEDRVKTFFEWRLEEGDPNELAEFGFWLEATCLEEGWRLNAFCRILDVWEADEFPRRLDWETIADMLPEHTGEVVECFVKVVERFRGDSVYIRAEPARRILSAGLASEDETVKRGAQRARESLLNSGRFNILMLEN